MSLYYPKKIKRKEILNQEKWIKEKEKY